MNRRVQGMPLTMDFFIERSIPEPNSGCWIWIAGGIEYGNVKVDGKTKKAHRVCFEIFHNKKIGDDNVICHKCDVPYCVNPGHLFEGTQKENAMDCVKKNRHPRYSHKPEDCHMTKLKAADVIDIRSSKLSLKELSEKYGVCKQTVHDAKTGRSWKSLGVVLTNPDHQGE